MSNVSAEEQALRPTIRRLESFSDGVFAIVVTIMVFEIRIPDSLASAWDPAALRQFAEILFTYALSFFVIVNLWTSHHYLVFTLGHPTRSTIWLNNLLLFCVTLIPVTTRFLGLHPYSSRAAAAYGLVGALGTISFMLLRSHASRIAENDVHRSIHRRVLHLTWFFLAIYALSVPLAFVSPLLAWMCFVIVPPMVFFLPAIRAQHPAGGHRALERSCP
jgi:uncharacterized membrane protein